MLARRRSKAEHHAAMERSSAASPPADARTEEAVTNAPNDPSWARLRPHPENARPPPFMDPPMQHNASAPAAIEWTPETGEDDYSYQDPSLTPGVINISAELRWRHRERQRQSIWAKQQGQGSAHWCAGPMSGPERRNEAPPWYAAREETTRNYVRKAHGRAQD